jgi:imidazolonepropionase-like amidohydrolase
MMKHVTIAAMLALAAGSPLAAQTAAAPAQPAAEPVTVIHAGTLLHEAGRPARRNVSVVIRGRRIAEVRDGFADLPGARVVDLRDHTVMPGLIDSHVHFRGSLDDRIQNRLQASVRDYEDAAFTAQMHAKRTLLAGFTTVRDLGNDPRLVTTLRDAIEGGMFAGPTIVAAGSGISVSGGHSDGRNGLNRDLAGIATEQGINTCDGPDDCRRAVRSQISFGVDVIKIAASGGVLSNVPGGLAQQMMDDEIRAVVQTARSFGRKVAAHAHGVDGVNAALKAGVASIEHGTFTNDESFRLYKQSGAYYVPTLIAPVAALADGRRGALTPAQMQKAEEAAGNAERSFARAVREGVKIAFGTDAGVARHGDNAQEFALMTRNGMSAAAAIRSATVDAAELLGRSGTIGTIAAGKDADIVAVRGDPLTDIRLLENVQFVMKHGRVHKLGGERQLTAVD